MKVRCRIEMDTEAGDYEVYFENKSNPGKSMNYHELKKMLSKVIKDWERKLETGIDSDEQVTKFIH